MRTTKRSDAHRRCISCRRPLFDRLETRTALSGSTFGGGFSFNPLGPSQGLANTDPLAITSATPANQAQLTSSPSTIEVEFNQALNEFSLGLADFQLFQVNSSGSTSPLTESQARLIESLDPSSAQNQIDLSLSKPLRAGKYELVLSGSNQVSSVSGATLANDGQDEVITQFTIAPPDSTLQTAIRLGPIGSTVLTSTGTLNLTANPGAVNYYELTIEPGHHWSLGLAVNSSGSLSTTLSLFAADDQLIATSSVGLASDPGDPFLFVGLGPGTYYVGISAQGNVPDPSGTNDFSEPSSQEVGSGTVDGTYQLQAVADVADQPTQVLGVRLDEADPLWNRPTGLTIQFSGALQPAGLDQPYDPPLQLVDQNGMTWGVTTVGYDPADGQLHLVFDEELPKGTYTLELTSPESLLDLADDVPVAPGLAAGSLAKFTIASTSEPPAGDLGPIFTGAGASNLTSNITVNSQSTVQRQFTVIAPGVYAIEGIKPGSGLTYSLTNSQGQTLDSGPADSPSGASDIALQDGVYTLSIVNTTASSIETPVILLHKETQFSQLIEGGISQGAALNLRLVTPQSNFGSTGDQSQSAADTSLSLMTTATSTNSGVVGSSTTGISLSPTNSRDSGTSGSFALNSSSSSGPAVVNLLFGLGPVGLPSTQSNQISVVGPTGNAGNFAMASNAPGLSPGLIGIPESELGQARRANNSRHDQRVDIPEVIPEAPGNPEQVRNVSTESGVLARDPASRRADDQSLAKSEWISRFASKTVGWIRDLATIEDESVDETQKSAPMVAQSLESSLTDEARVTTASMASPISLGALGLVMAFRFRKMLRNQFARLSHRIARPSLPTRPLLYNLNRPTGLARNVRCSK